jgi:heat shock protein HslJ
MSRFTVSLLLAMAMLGCARAGSTQSPLAPGQWRLVSIGPAAAQPAEVSRRPWLLFAPDSGRVSGNLSCNRASGTFTIDGEALRIGPLISTMMACADEALNRQEAEFAGAIQATNRFQVRGDTLELLMGSRVMATLVRSP